MHLDATILFMYVSMQDFQKYLYIYLYTSEFSTQFANHFLLV